MRTDREKAYMAVLAMMIVGATFYLGYILITKTIPEENRDIINVALGMILGLSGTVVGYYFGSSKSSSDKTAFLSETPSKIDNEKEKYTQTQEDKEA